jgi:hypothetical protein
MFLGLPGPFPDPQDRFYLRPIPCQHYSTATLKLPLPLTLVYRTDEELGKLGLDCECLGGGR